MEEKLVSIIVPAYNTEEYIGKCLESLILQTYKNIEIIVVDDGSIDNTSKIVKKIAEENIQVKYFGKTNGGAGSARNYGIKRALGSFVMFVDSDDYLSFDAIEKLMREQKGGNYDIVFCNIVKVIGDQLKKYKVIMSLKFDDKTNFLLENAGPCNMIISKKLIDQTSFSFPEKIIYEDLAVIPILGMNAEKIKYLDEDLYFYVTREASSMNNLTYEKKLEDIFIALHELETNYNKLGHNYEEIFDYIWIRRIMSAILRFLKFKEGKHGMRYLQKQMVLKAKNPRNNIYVKMLSRKQKLVLYLIENRMFFALSIVERINRLMKGLNE